LRGAGTPEQLAAATDAVTGTGEEAMMTTVTATAAEDMPPVTGTADQSAKTY
jgi:hypothetical protein